MKQEIEIANIKNKDSFEEWLKTLSDEVCYKIAPILAYRCVLRVVPYVACDFNNNLTIIILRALAITGAYHRNMVVGDDTAIHKAAGTTFTASDKARSSNASYAAAIYASAHATNAVAHISSDNNVHSATFAVAHASDYVVYSDVSFRYENFWHILQQDIKYYQQQHDLNNIHLWHGKENIPSDIVNMLNEWKKYHYDNIEENWLVWIKFYEAKLVGKEYFSDIIYQELAQWSHDNWIRQPKEVNTDIANLIDKYNIKYVNKGTSKYPFIGLSSDIMLSSESTELLKKAFDSCVIRFENPTNHNYLGADNCKEILSIINEGADLDNYVKYFLTHCFNCFFCDLKSL